MTHPTPSVPVTRHTTCVPCCGESLVGIECKQGMRWKYLETQLQFQFWGVNKEAKEGRGVRASRCACVLPQEVLSNLAFQCLIWEVGERTSQGSG